MARHEGSDHARPVGDPLCLVGMSGIGKSHWARRLERELGMVRYDCDGEIAARLSSIVRCAPDEEPVHALGRWMGMPWSDGYADREARYLALEEEVTASALERALAASGERVIDTTGSAVYLSPARTERLRARTRVVYLRTPDAGRDAMLQRYLVEPKPLVWGGAFVAPDGAPPEAALPECFRALLEWRDQRYVALAHVTLDGGELASSTSRSARDFLALAGL
jgi:shikimate kinase